MKNDELISAPDLQKEENKIIINQVHKTRDLLIVELSFILPRGRFIRASDEDFFTRGTPCDKDGDTLCLLRDDDVDDTIVGGRYATG